MRFIIEGERAFTAVEGEKVMMERGDMVLTPAWEWHDHGNEGDRPMIWLDGLDLPLWQTLRLSSPRNSEDSRFPSALFEGRLELANIRGPKCRSNSTRRRAGG